MNGLKEEKAEPGTMGRPDEESNIIRSGVVATEEVPKFDDEVLWCSIQLLLPAEEDEEAAASVIFLVAGEKGLNANASNVSRWLLDVTGEGRSCGWSNTFFSELTDGVRLLLLRILLLPAGVLVVAIIPSNPTRWKDGVEGGIIRYGSFLRALPPLIAEAFVAEEEEFVVVVVGSFGGGGDLYSFISLRTCSL
jgi:hypothetical protein